MALIYAVFILLLYRYGVSALEHSVRVFYYNTVVKKMVTDKQLLKQSDHFNLGIYRPELPYHFDNVYTIQKKLGVRIQTISFYQAWGEGEEHQFKTRVVNNLSRGGFVPFITWEPWLAAFSEYKGQMPDSSLAIISRGNFDSYIRAWARKATKFGKPLFVRPLHEMTNDVYPWSSAYKNSPEMFIECWKHIVGIFREEGAENVAFVWTPYKPSDTTFYPGNQWVDWIGLDIFNYGPLSENGMWIDFFTLTRSYYDAVKGYDKPIIIAEVGTVEQGGNKNDWYRDMFRTLGTRTFPLVEGLIVFDTPVSKAPNGLTVDLSMTSDEAIYSVIDNRVLVDSLNVKQINTAAHDNNDHRPGNQ
ncbi:MAG: glycoside hydrolase family 26 protein [Chitinispirillaceae bacterium]